MAMHKPAKPSLPTQLPRGILPPDCPSVGRFGKPLSEIPMSEDQNLAVGEGVFKKGALCRDLP